MFSKIFTSPYFRFFAALIVFGIWIWGAEAENTSFGGDPRSTLADIVHGKAHNPFVQRALIPLLTRAVHSTLPESTWDKFEASLLSIPKVQKETQRLGWEVNYLSEYLVALAIALATLIGFAFVLKPLWLSFYTTSNEVASFVPLIGLLVLPPFFHVGTHYLYDFPAMMLFALGLLLLLKQRWPWYYMIFAAGCLNKETMILMFVAFWLLYFDRLGIKELVGQSVLQVVIFLVIKTGLLLAYADNPGGITEFHFFGNLHYLLLGYTITDLLIVCVLIGLVAFNFKQKHILLQRLMWLCWPFGILILAFGSLAEVRAWLEILPVVLFLSLHSILFDFLGIKFQPTKPEFEVTNR